VRSENAVVKRQPNKMSETTTSAVALAAFRRGDAAAVVEAFMEAHIDTEATERKELALVDLANFAIAIRRRDVSVIGRHDVFVRHTPAGSLRQVVNGVTLSLADDTLYQLPKRMKCHEGTDDPYNEASGGRFEWKSVIADKTKANVSYQGLLQMNATAGCAVGMPPSVIVDGEERTNPYIDRTKTKSGRLGDVQRIVVAVNVVGPAPMTGNPVIVQYRLDLDPAKDLQHMLTNLMNDSDLATSVYLIDEDQWADEHADMEQAERRRWKFLAMYGGVGIAHDLRMDKVRKCYTKFIDIMQNALKKALTVARRNAMKSHPALAKHTVRVDNTGSARVAVYGWAADEGDLGRYMALMDRLARGLVPDFDDLGAKVEHIILDAEYDAEKDATGDDELDPVLQGDEPDTGLDADTLARNGLIAQIDRGLEVLPGGKISELDYRPGDQSAEELQAVLTHLNAIIDGGE